MELESGPEPEEEDDKNLQSTHHENEITRGGVGFTTTSLASGLHRVLKVSRDTPAALSGAINPGDILTRIDKVVLKGVQTGAVAVLLAGPPGSEVELELLNADGTPRVMRLGRVALCVNTVSWARAVLPLRLRRRELLEPLID